MSIFRTIAMFLYLFGYMIVHYGTLRRGERALAAGDTETVEQLVDRHIPRWSRGILKVTGVTLTVEGLENIPKEGPCVAVDFDLPDGQWTLHVITVSYKGGEKQTEGYLNPLDSAATKVLLDTVYEPIYAHFGEEFGKTLCGFFSDEPRLGNIHGAEDAAIGHNSAMNLPWRDGMRTCWPENWPERL